MIAGRLLLATALFFAALAAYAEPRQAACNALSHWAGGADGVRIGEARFYANRNVRGPGGSETLPPHCHVVGSFEHRIGVDGRD